MLEHYYVCPLQRDLDLSAVIDLPEGVCLFECIAIIIPFLRSKSIGTSIRRVCIFLAGLTASIYFYS